MTRRLVLDELNRMVEEKVELARKAISSMEESRNNDSKSTAGDKHEVGRAMAQIELDKAKMQLAKAEQLRADLSKIDIDTPSHEVGFGSLVHLADVAFFISVGLGNVTVAEQAVFAISLASPIGQQLRGKKLGEHVMFKGKSEEILSLA